MSIKVGRHNPGVPGGFHGGVGGDGFPVFIDQACGEICRCCSLLSVPPAAKKKNSLPGKESGSPLVG